MSSTVMHQIQVEAELAVATLRNRVLDFPDVEQRRAAATALARELLTHAIGMVIVTGETRAEVLEVVNAAYDLQEKDPLPVMKSKP